MYSPPVSQIIAYYKEKVISLIGNIPIILFANTIKISILKLIQSAI